NVAPPIPARRDGFLARAQSSLRGLRSRRGQASRARWIRDRRFALIAALATAVACGAESSSTGPRRASPRITVRVAMVGNGEDSDGFVVNVGGKPLLFAGAGTQVDSDLVQGPYTVESAPFPTIATLTVIRGDALRG